MIIAFAVRNAQLQQQRRWRQAAPCPVLDTDESPYTHSSPVVNDVLVYFLIDKINATAKALCHHNVANSWECCFGHFA